MGVLAVLIFGPYYSYGPKAVTAKRTYKFSGETIARFERLVPPGQRSQAVERLLLESVEEIERNRLREDIVEGLAAMADVNDGTAREWASTDTDGWPALMRRGTVVRVRLDPVLGSEQGGERPAIVVSPTFINERSNVVLVAPITSKKMERVYPFEAKIDHLACGLTLPAKAMLNRIWTIDKTRLSGEYGVADEETIAMVDAAIRIATGLVPI